MNNFSNRLRYLRISHSLTQTKLSQDIEKVFGYPITKATISQYENGNREPNINMLINLSQYFNCSIDYLVGVSDHIKIIDSSEFANKMILLKSIVDLLPKIDYIHSYDLIKMLNNYIDTNDL